jgi:arylsulfatase A-like enzyme
MLTTSLKLCLTSLLASTFICVSVARSYASDVEDATRPNIVLIMADDLGFSDLGCYGGEIETPTLDGLASEGVRFTQFYNTAKCHSSRVCLLTGLYCNQAGNTSLSNGVTIAEALRESGYFTIMTGKWHLKGEPTQRGFDRYFGHLSGATNFFTGDNTFRLNSEPFNDFDEDFYTTDANTDYAIDFLDEAQETDKPFFLYVAYNAPHYPLQAPEEDVRKYMNSCVYDQGWDVVRAARYERQLAMGLINPDWRLSPRPDNVEPWDELSDDDKAWESKRMSTFAGMVDRLDSNIDRIVDYLEDKDLFDNTLFLFCADNGACPFERTRGKDLEPWDPKSYWTYDNAWANVGNTPFRWYKQNQHEGGISSPLIVHWPNGLDRPAGSFVREPGHLIDIMATAIDVAGAEYPTEYDGRTITPLQGVSLLPLIEGDTREGHDWLYFQFTNNRALRRGDWKVVSARGGPWELYNIEDDRTEMNNLADERPELTAELIRLWHVAAENVDQAPENSRRSVSETMQPYPGDWRGGKQNTN